jgi:AcrR family transcriptional regulator
MIFNAKNSMSVIEVKTRDKFIDAARRLFAHTGVENTTMNDIAEASKKGRRTLYTHFKSKADIFNAVVKSELNLLFNSLDKVIQKELPADEKLLEYILIRFESIKQVVHRNGTFQGDFFRDMGRVEKVRKSFDVKEIRCIQGILEEGVRQNIFDVPNAFDMAIIIHYAFKGLELPYILGFIPDIDSQNNALIEAAIHLLFKGIKKDKN